MIPPAAAKPLEPQRVLPSGGALETERRLARVRVVVVASGLVLFPFVADRPGYRPALGWTILVLGAVYALAVLRFEPYWRSSAVATGARVATDVVFTLAWIAATGGADSPWFVAMLLSLATTSYRFGSRAAVATALTYSAGYVAVAAATGQLPSHAIDVAIRVTYLLLLGAATLIIVAGRSNRLAWRLRLLGTMQEVARVGTWEWSLETNSLTWSDELRRIFALPDGVGPTLDFFTRSLHPDDRDQFFASVEQAVMERRSFQLGHRILLADGTVRWLHCRGVLLQDADGTPLTVVGSSQDVTDQKMLEAQLLLSDRLASIGTMASGIAHEINNPLAYVATNLEVIDRQLSASDARGAPQRFQQVREALDAARHGSDRVREIVRGLKTFARPEDQTLASVPLARVVDFAARIASREIESRARLVREYADVGPVVAIEARLTQVFVNLLVNAAHAIERGTPDKNEIHVRIGEASRGRAFVEIRDTGSGISAANLERIFDPFFTTKPTGVGTGLGLAICKGIVTELEGEITVESEVGRGSTFRVTLPTVSDTNVIDARPSPSRAKLPRRNRVLIVDDEDRYAKSLELLLSEDYDVARASDGKRALDLFSQGERFDVILCDLMMPRMTGMELHAALAELCPEQRARMVFLTGGATDDLARAFLARPDVRHLEKPLELPKLEAAISDVTA
ncbi:MAG: response regulator [Labilithrix sp.]|nr:response regulator [Labilithrix sp.]